MEKMSRKQGFKSFELNSRIRKPSVRLFKPFTNFEPMTENTVMADQKIDISLCGCGFLGIYHVGVVAALRDNLDNFPMCVDRIYGSSAGALIGAAVLNNFSSKELLEMILSTVLVANTYSFGTINPFFRLGLEVKNLLKSFKPDCWTHLNNRLFVNLTEIPFLSSKLISNYNSVEEVVQVLTCSSFVPFISGFIPPQYENHYYIDGGWSDNMPVTKNVENSRATITISPFSGWSDICPKDSPYSELNWRGLKLANTHIHLSPQNLKKLFLGFVFPSVSQLRELCSQGYLDAVDFIMNSRYTTNFHLLSRPNSMSHSNSNVKIFRSVSFETMPLSRLEKNTQEFHKLLDEIFDENERMEMFKHSYMNKIFSIVDPLNLRRIPFSIFRKVTEFTCQCFLLNLHFWLWFFFWSKQS